MGIIQTGRVEIAYETSGSGEAGAVILIRGQGTQLIHWPKSFYEAFIQEWVEYVRQYGSKKYFEGDDDSRRVAAAAFDRCYSPDGANRQLLAVFSMKNTRDQVKTISVPTLVVHGGGDLLIPPARGREIADFIPGATFKLIDGMGHDIPPGLGKPLAEIVLAHIRSMTNQTD